MSKLWRRLVFAFRRGRFERDLEEEMRFHLEMKAQSGGGTEEARYAAQRRFGNTLALREASREMWGWGTIDRLWQDLRYALRVLRKSPGFTLAAILTLSLGIGVNTSIFSLLHAFVLRQLPVRDPSTLALVFSMAPRDSQVMLCSYPDYIDFRDKNHVFSGLVAVQRQDPYLDDSGRKVLVDFVSENYFPVLAAGPALHPELVAVVSDRFWKRHFNSDPSVAGKTLSLNGQRFTVIAVAPRDFGGLTLEPTDIWAPLATYPQVMGDREILGARQGHWLAVAGRLKPGATLQHAQAEMAVLARNLERQYPETNKGFGVVVSPASWVNPRTRNNVVPIVALLMGAVGLVLLIACANIANLLLALGGQPQNAI